MQHIEKIIEAAMSYDMSDVMQRYAEKTRLPPDALKEHEREIKRFLALSAANPGKYGMRGPLDELWHTFIIFTSSYARFCHGLGGGFIHHRPEPPKKRGAKAATKAPKRNSYIDFLEDYRKVFKETPAAHLWPTRPGGDVMDPSCDQCGIFCSQTCAAIELRPVSKRF
ncbi:MAG: hypothetical protein AABN95_10000 [Acidobacteriota bacterium]